jgi:glycosyltransferase involved in cell wall biosynthesis
MGGEPAEIESLRKRAARLGVAHRVFFSGKRPPTELPAFLDLADVLVSPRRVGRNTPFKVYTYLASGKPLVATAIATHTQILTADIATLVGVSAEDLAAGIRSVLGDPLGAIERAIRGRALVEREYGRKAFAGKVQRAYEHVARAVKPRPGA